MEEENKANLDEEQVPGIDEEKVSVHEEKKENRVYCVLRFLDRPFIMVF